MKSICFRRVRMLAISCAALLLLGVGTLAQQAPPALPPQAQAGIAGRFIVTVAPGASPEDVARDHGILPVYVYRSALNGFAGSLSDIARAGLLGDARVQDMEADQIVSVVHEVPGGVQANSPGWGLDRIDQRALPLDSSYTYPSDAHDVTAYVIDSGIRYTHTDFGGRASFGFDAFAGDGSDCHRHGTHVAGILGGSAFGVAKGVRLVSIRVLGCDGTGPLSSVIAGVDWVTAFHNSPAVANMSLAAGGISTALDTAVHKMISSGVATAIAAGNQNADSCVYSPARVTNAMTIGNSDSSDVRAATSSYGTCVDFFAPGVGILSASHLDDVSSRLGSGTSMASPHAAGVAALYLQNHLFASPIEVRDALLSFATKGVVTDSNTPNNHVVYSAQTLHGSGDYVSPSAVILSPTAGTTLQRNKAVTIQVSAVDNVGITVVEIRAGSTLICSDLAAPYSCSWKVPANPRGATYNLQATAFDAAGNAQASTFLSVVAN